MRGLPTALVCPHRIRGARSFRFCWTSLTVTAASLGLTLQAAEVPKAPVPQSPFIGVVYRYADTMLERGRDAYGPQPSGLFLSALDRVTMTPLTNRPPAPTGVREGDRVGAAGGPLTGANPQHDANLLRLLYTLSELSSKAKYREAADAELKWFLDNGLLQHELAALGRAPGVGRHPTTHQSTATRSGRTSSSAPGCCGTGALSWRPKPAGAFALGLWEHQIADHQTGAFDRHAGYAKHAPVDGKDFPRHAGFYIRTWAVGVQPGEGPNVPDGDRRFARAI